MIQFSKQWNWIICVDQIVSLPISDFSYETKKKCTYKKYTDIGEDDAKSGSQIEVIAQMTTTIATGIIDDLLFNCIAFNKKIQKWLKILTYWK